LPIWHIPRGFAVAIVSFVMARFPTKGKDGSWQFVDKKDENRSYRYLG